MIEGELSTIIIGDGTEGAAYGPETKEIQMAWSDITAIPNEQLIPEPDSMNIYFRCEQDTLDTILGDSDFFVHWYGEVGAEPEVEE
ncbi:MAG: hypothetical protein DRP42_02670 [Tenericutes bacterium]|nr:MAG: hypothetical protein DRP42_02670 [Mycoplasmatota bacterium]